MAGVIGPFTPNDLMTEAAELLGIVEPGGNLSAEDSNSILRSMNLMLSKWSTKGISARAYFTETFPISAGKRQYTWGTTGTPDWVSTRPTKIITCDLQYITQGNLILPMIPCGSNQYQAFGDRLILTGPPKYIFLDMLEPNALGSLYPIPDGGYNVIITSDKALVGMTDPNVQFTIDPIYMEPIVTNLAYRIAPKYGRPITEELKSMAKTSFADLINITAPDMFFTTDYPKVKMGTSAPILDGGYY